MKPENIRKVKYASIGEVSFIRKPGGRNLKISLRPFRGVEVTVPLFVSDEAAVRFVEEKITWIRAQREKMARFEKRATIFTEETAFSTKDHTLVMGRHEKATVRAEIRDHMIRIAYPSFAPPDDPKIQQVVRKAIAAALKMEAEKYLPPVTSRLAEQCGFNYSSVTCRNNKTRWGSCSRDNRISLNIHLMRLPEHLQRYIVLHELCHTIHKHHQKSFWQLLDKVTGGRARLFDKELNAYSPDIF